MALYKQQIIMFGRMKTAVHTNPCRGFQTAQQLQREIKADVVIAGGGMVGTAMCCALANSKRFQERKIILLEAGNEPAPKDWRTAPFENRVSSVTPGSASFLDEIGVWEKIVSRRHHPYDDLHVWDAVGSGSIDLRSSDINEKCMAFMVENSVIIESLMEKVKEMSANVDVQFNAKIDNVFFPYHSDVSSPNLVEVQLENGDIVTSKLLVGADGPNSFIRNKASISTTDYDYEQSAVVATLNIKYNSSNNTAWQRFLSTGPIALLPLSNEVSSLVWSTSRQQAKELVQDSEEEFIAKVNNAISGKLSQNSILGATNDLLSSLVSTISPGQLAASYMNKPPIVTNVHSKSRGMFPLMLKHSEYYVKSRLALVGDSAHRIHPMAGLGVNLGFGDAQKLVEILESAVYNGEDYGSIETLLPYETDRQRHVLSVIAAINSLHKLFSTTMTPVVFARTLGLHATNAISPIKNLLIKSAMQ